MRRIWWRWGVGMVLAALLWMPSSARAWRDDEDEPRPPCPSVPPIVVHCPPDDDDPVCGPCLCLPAPPSGCRIVAVRTQHPPRLARRGLVRRRITEICPAP